MKVAVIGLAGQSVFLPVERFHEGGETIRALGIHTEPGGKGFNQAVAAARYGARVSFLSAVGCDGAEQIGAFMRAEGVDCALQVKPGGTAYAAIVTDTAGLNRVTEYIGAELDPSDAEAFSARIAAADILLLSNEIPAAVNLTAASIAAAAGTRVILNPAPARPLARALTDAVWLFTPNEFECAWLEGFTNVVVTLGGKGCLIRATGERVPAYPVRPVDTTGAGDTFNGVLAACLADGAELAEAVRTANAAAAVSVTGKYAVSAIPFRREIEKFLVEKGGKL